MPKRPKLRTVEKYKPPYPLNKFPKGFAVGLGREVVYLLASRGGRADIEGKDWEQIFARLVGAEWQPSNVGLDDIVLKQTAWGAKTVKAGKPHICKKVRLISGRNSPAYSFGENRIAGRPATEVGEQVLAIWNERVTSVRAKYNHLRTVVLVKGNNMLEVAVFESETCLYMPDQYAWEWNKNNNLEARALSDGTHAFTWQPHGSQFTIIEKVPANRLCIRIRKPSQLNREDVLSSLGFDASWVEIVPPESASTTLAS